MNSHIPKSVKFQKISISKVKIKDNFWTPKLETNASTAIFHQWAMLEETKCIDNFRILTEKEDGFREGLVYWDSDAHKWSEAAARILVNFKDKNLEDILKEYISLIEKTQTKDGYLFTYNQFNFPKKRWKNLLIEHELYSLGHLIEAGIAHHDISGRKKYLNIAIKTADLLVKVFNESNSRKIPGHQEIEIALIKLFRKTKNEAYLILASNFIEKRGRNLFHPFQLLREYLSYSIREKKVTKRRRLYYSDNSLEGVRLLNGLEYHGKSSLNLKYILSALSGQNLQNQKPIRKMKKPVGHSVRFGYYATAAALLYQETGDATLLATLEMMWDNMVQKKMYLTGGIGARAILEGFGNDYELDNLLSYNETCAAISSVFWNWEMLLSTGDSKYADLIEWQLYNAVLPGMSLDGKSYAYSNPLESRGGVKRQEWYKTACCPSNISRTLAQLGKFIYTSKVNEVWIHQYIGSELELKMGRKANKPVQITMNSELPWEGNIRINIVNKEKYRFTLYLRIPSWTRDCEIIVNGEKIEVEEPNNEKVRTASGYSPYDSYYITIQKSWKVNNKIEIYFPVRVKQQISHPKVKNNRSKIALTRGPLVYCFEGIDNPTHNIPSAEINLDQPFKIEQDDLLNGIISIRAKDFGFNTLTAIPYYSWANRGDSPMQIWIDDFKK
ncbi:MAG: glycoside hydrolase family 127 protein [Asgard group archaeon]|nr:glycoside hydrolase family 127 protein [Asgard group archaeon]